MSRIPTRRPRRRDERGMTTSEYAVGTVGACTVGGVLVQIAQSDWFNSMIKGVFEKIPTLGLF
ncbi:MAG: DUF4244 domain-containing protein [Aeromicrobium sp.]|nr:DUF4244 domain-containing protein [Aeromicrobium sp.]MDF1704779.1 DUF4244 domain-containing protein [Aeromicrobium sp.]